MLQIVLIRPGSTDYDQQQRIQGALDIPLNEQGNVEVAQLIDQLQAMGIETVYASVGQPAHESGKAIAKALKVKLKKLDRMQNLNQGLWQGMRIEDVRRKQPKVYRQWQEQPENVCPPEGEMLNEAEGRVRATMAKLLKRHKEGVIGLVVSEPMASLVRHFIQQDELGDLWKVADEHGHFESLEVEPGELLAQIGENGG